MPDQLKDFNDTVPPIVSAGTFHHWHRTNVFGSAVVAEFNGVFEVLDCAVHLVGARCRSKLAV